MKQIFQTQTSELSIRRPFSIIKQIFVMLLSAAVLFFALQLITEQDFLQTIRWTASHLLPAFITTAALSVIMTFWFAVTVRFAAAFFLTAFPTLLLTAINHYKTAINGFPLTVTDLTFAKNMGSIAKFALPQLQLTAATAAGILLTVILLFLLIMADRKRMKIREAKDSLCATGPKSTLISRLICVILTASLTAVILCSSQVLTFAASHTSAQSQEERVRDYGFLYGFYLGYAASYADRIPPEEYSRLMAEIKSETESYDVQKISEDTVRPSVILVMSESFLDISQFEGLDIPRDITPNYHRLAKESTSGRFYSNTFAGGTGNAEIEALTGVSNDFLKEGHIITNLEEETYRRLPSLSSVLKDAGYHNIFLHSHTNELYNREMIYSQLNFDEILFSDSFPKDAKRRGGFLSDQAFTEKIISLYEENKERNPQQPLFISAVSMENHQPYNEDKFAYETDFHITGDSLSRENQSILNTYANGLFDADRSLGGLTDYFTAQKEPVMLIFFGDHRPNLGNGGDTSVYTDLGVVPTPDSSSWDSETVFDMLSTNYLIWTNYRDVPLPDKDTSSSMLVLDILTQLQFPLNGYYRYLKENVAPDMLLSYPRVFADPSGKVTEEIPEEKRESMLRYRMIITDIVYGTNEIFGSDESAGEKGSSDSKK